jgi:hypothetical protein
MLSESNLDKRICDCQDAENTQTYREFIRESEKAFVMGNTDIDGMSDKELNGYIEFLDFLWDK